MANELNNTTTTGTGADPAPAAGSQTTQEGTPAPTTEQKNAFQKFWDSLFGGKGEQAPSDGDNTKPAGNAAPQKTEGATYTETDLQAKLEEAKAAWQAEQEEKNRLEKLSPEERAKAEGAAKDKELNDLKAQLLQRDLKESAVAALQKDGFPVALADLLTYTDKDAMEQSMASVTETFKASLEAAVKDRLRGKTPEGLGGAATAENSMKDQIARNIRGGLN